MHWPYPPNPAEYQYPGLGFVVGMLAIAVTFIVVLFYATRSNASLLQEPKPELDEVGREEEKARE